MKRKLMLILGLVLVLSITACTHDDASKYVDSIKEAGFTQHTNEQINSNIVKYKGMDSERTL